MLTARQTDELEGGRPSSWMETAVRLESGTVLGHTRIWTTRRVTTVVGAVRVLAVDDAGTVLGFTGERRFRAGAGAVRMRYADRVVEWSSALFSESLAGAVRLEVVHFRPPRRTVIDRVAEKS